jgi:hypothetical protein
LKSCPRVLKTYEHYKGGRYIVTGVGQHSETDEQFVVYRPVGATETDDFVLRPLSMFTEVIEIEGNLLPRFRPVDNND